MADPSYQAKVYFKQGSTELVVASDGLLSVEDGGKIAMPVVTESTSANLSNYGLSICGSTKVKKLYTIDAPQAGVQKVIEFTVTAATGWVNVHSTAAIEDSKSSKNYLKAVGNGSAILFGTSTKWLLAAKSTSVSHTTSTT